MAIVAENISMAFAGQPVLENFNFTLPDSGVVFLTGPSGCGKTTLLHVLAGLCLPDSGTIQGLEGKRISLLFQEDRLLPWLSAAQNVALVLPGGQAELARPWLEMVELAEEAHTYPAALSGGMRRRLALARALAYEGAVLLLDEPTNGLDTDLANRIMGRVKKQYAGRLVVVVTHDRAFAAQHADTLIELSGPPLRIMHTADRTPTHI